MKEFDFIELLKSASISPPEGIGDDAALVGDFLIAKDILAEGVHFYPNAAVNSVINHLFVSNISDIAAMGGRTDSYKALLGVAVSRTLSKKALADAVNAAVTAYNVTLIGGDTVSSLGGSCFSLTLIGQRGKYVLCRSGARAGDSVYLSRSLGEAGFALDQGKEHVHTSEKCLGAFLGSRQEVTSCVDISDGLGRDLSHIAEQSGQGIIIYEALLPVPETLIFSQKRLEYILSSGEEYALAFTVEAGKENSFERAVQGELSRTVYKIGEVVTGHRCLLRRANGGFEDISSAGYEHE